MDVVFEDLQAIGPGVDPKVVAVAAGLTDIVAIDLSTVSRHKDAALRTSHENVVVNDSREFWWSRAYLNQGAVDGVSIAYDSHIAGQQVVVDVELPAVGCPDVHARWAPNLDVQVRDLVMPTPVHLVESNGMATIPASSALTDRAVSYF